MYIQGLNFPNFPSVTKFDFSLQFPNYFQQAVVENTQTYQLEVVILIFHQILATNLQGIV